MPNQSGKIVLVLVLFLLLIGVTVYFFLPVFKNEYGEQVPSSSVKTYESSQEASESSVMHEEYFSKDFKMKIINSDNFQIKDNFPIFTLNKRDKKIEIIRNGTNFDNLEDYIEDFDTKREVRELSRRKELMNSYPVIRRELTYGDADTKQKSNYLYVDNFVYIFSTSDEALYPVLDEIVQSFEYKP